MEELDGVRQRVGRYEVRVLVIMLQVLFGTFTPREVYNLYKSETSALEV